MRVRRKIRRKNRRGISTYRQDAVDTGSHTEMPHTIFRYLLCEPPIIWKEKERSSRYSSEYSTSENLAPSNFLRTSVYFARSSNRLSSNVERTSVINNARMLIADKRTNIFTADGFFEVRNVCETWSKIVCTIEERANFFIKRTFHDKCFNSITSKWMRIHEYIFRFLKIQSIIRQSRLSPGR